MEDDKCLFIDPNMENFLNPNQEQDQPPLFLDFNFPSPFFDPINTNNNYTHDQNHIMTSTNKAINIIDLPSESKPLKKRSVGKKDRHSKIHTAQGLRDRRMRLSLHIARKFFDLQDLLGFDKASKTIEWLFCKSNKAIKEVAENFSPQNCEVGLSSHHEIKNVTNNHENSKIKNTRSRKRIQDSRDQARARARDRTRERLMIKELEKSKLLVEGNPNDQESNKLGLGHKTSPNNHNAEELGFICSSPSEPINQESSSSGSTLMNHINPPAGWLNSCNGFLADDFVSEFIYNYGIVPTTVSLTGDVYEQNPSSFLMSSSTTNILQ